jgi:hypothetical protein
MALDGEITLTVHGLEVDNGNVRAEVFISKFSALLKTLHMADKHANARKAHDFLITGLEQGSAHATLRERVSLRKIIPVSSVDFVQEVVTAVYNGDRNIRRFPADIIESLSAFTNGIGKKFSHGEIHFSNDNAIRVDDYLEKQLNRALQRIHGELDEAERFFEGVAIETFDGIVKQIDARHGTLVRGKLVLTAGGKEIDCIFRSVDMPVLRESFDRRARVTAAAHYDGESQLPLRLDVRAITLVQEGKDISRWKGALVRKRNASSLDE